MSASELRILATDLRKSPQKMRGEVKGVIDKGGLELKNRMKKEMEQSRWRHFGHITRSIDYDETGGDDNPGVEVGPNAARHSSAALAGIAYFGNSMGGGGTVADPRDALEAEAEVAHKFISRIAGDVL